MPRNTQKIIIPNGVRIFVNDYKEVIIRDGNSAMSYFENVEQMCLTSKIAINKEAIIEDFFNLSSGIAGEVAQKVVNKKITLAIIGDFSQYKSKALHDYMDECNKGANLFFVASENEAIVKLQGLMTEKEKMLAGELYDPADPELMKLWNKGKNLMLQYNNLDYSNN